jgi:hypothetical protein
MNALKFLNYRISFHSDMACDDHMPGAAFIHCIKQHQVCK